ncbi:hypothetical protein ACRALDRAFT_1065410 [Sodiomyces alcalophilus JCM 7366]|uniref:uncharacterized protein n=1 Tax=Sodiomyces alcalophilus JCM 7366 TaxID=591952 RepID=UPI0039B3B912
MWLALRHVRATIPISCRVATIQPRNRASSTLTASLLKASTPVAERLAETELWSHQPRRVAAKKKDAKTKTKTSRSKTKAAQVKKPTGDKSRVNIVSEKLCGTCSRRRWHVTTKYVEYSPLT